jgi:hypothetical protein
LFWSDEWGLGVVWVLIFDLQLMLKPKSIKFIPVLRRK